MKTPFITALSLNILAGCCATTIPQSSGPSLPAPRQPATHPALSLKTVDEDFERAMANGDYRFIGLMGVGLYVPGVPREFETGGYGIRVIEGTSDAPATDEDQRFNELARAYAQRYNELLLKKIAH